MQIPSRFNGPPGSGNGGWSAGAFARASGLGGVVEVTLRVPPPLDTDLAYDDGAFRTADGTLVASVRADGDAGDPVPTAPPQQAAAASAAYPGFARHPFPTCYVCGPERADGLRLFPGHLADGRTATPWTVPDDISSETMWAALDCPGGWAALHTGRTFVLGRIAARIDALPAPGTACVVVGRADTMQGRKAHTRSTVYGPDGAPLATARATWIAVASLD
jgi:hypothetical protein